MLTAQTYCCCTVRGVAGTGDRRNSEALFCYVVSTFCVRHRFWTQPQRFASSPYLWVLVTKRIVQATCSHARGPPQFQFHTSSSNCLLRIAIKLTCEGVFRMAAALQLHIPQKYDHNKIWPQQNTTTVTVPYFQAPSPQITAVTPVLSALTNSPGTILLQLWVHGLSQGTACGVLHSASLETSWKSAKLFQKVGPHVAHTA